MKISPCRLQRELRIGTGSHDYVRHVGGGEVGGVCVFFKKKIKNKKTPKGLDIFFFIIIFLKAFYNSGHVGQLQIKIKGKEK